eukprot:5895458-Pleurochrysis_carterae.AAC.3
MALNASWRVTGSVAIGTGINAAVRGGAQGYFPLSRVVAAHWRFQAHEQVVPQSREGAAARMVHFRATPPAPATPAPPPSPRPPESRAGPAAPPPHAVDVEHLSPPLAVDAGHVEARPSAVGVAVAVP